MIRPSFAPAIVLAAAACACAASRPGTSRPSAPPAAPVQMDRREEGIRLYFDRRYTEAATVLGAVVASSPQDGRALTFLGLAQVQGGQVDEGLGTLRRADELAPGSADVHYGLGLAYGYLKQLDASIEAFERAVRLDASHAYAHYHLGLAYYQRGRKDLAILHLQRFVELEPSAPEAPQVRVLLAELS